MGGFFCPFAFLPDGLSCTRGERGPAPLNGGENTVVSLGKRGVGVVGPPGDHRGEGVGGVDTGHTDTGHTKKVPVALCNDSL